MGAGKLDGAPPPDYTSEFIFLGDGDDAVVDPLVPGFDAAVQAYFDAGLGLNTVLMELTAVALGLDRGHFRAAYGEPAPASWLNRLRLAYGSRSQPFQLLCDPCPPHHPLFTALHALCSVLRVATMVIRR